MPERDCATCTKQALWGCEAVKIAPHPPNEPDHPSNWLNPAKVSVHVLGEETYACPRQHLHQNPAYWNWLLKFYGFYKRGHLPQAGAVCDQSNKAMELFGVLDDVNAECDRAEAERTKAQQTRGRSAPPAAVKRPMPTK